MTVDDDDFLAAVAPHLVSGSLQELQLNGARISHRTRLVSRFGNLAEVIRREDNGVFLFRGVNGGVTDIDQIGADGQLRAVLLHDAEGKQAGALRLRNGMVKIVCRQLVPADGKFRLCARGKRANEECGETERYSLFHGGLLRKQAGL